MSRNMDGATGFKKPSEFLNHLWQLDQLKSNPDFSDMDPANLILDENGEQLKVEGKKLSEYLKDPALNYFGKTLDSFLNSYMKENPDKSLNVIGQDAKPHAIGVKSMNGNGDVSEFGYASRPDGVNTAEVKQHIANVVTFGLVAGDPKKEFQILNGTTAEDLAESVAKSDSFQNILKNYSTIPGAEKSLVDLARNVSKGQVGEIAKPFRDSLTSVRESMNKAPETKTVQKTNTKTVEAKENVL